MLSSGGLHFRELAMTAIVVGLSACSQQSNGIDAGLPSTQLPAAAGSAVQIDASQLLYVSDAGTNEVQWFGWPKPQSTLGALNGLSEPQGLCNDGKDVYVANTGDSNVVVYAADTSQPARTLEETGYYPDGCSYDTSGKKLAVVNAASADVALYAGGQGSPKYISSSLLTTISLVQYDNSGNLYLFATSTNGQPVLAELAANSKTIKIKCSHFHPWASNFPGTFAWDGQYLLTNDQASGDVYRVKGCDTVGTFQLTGSSDVVGFYVQGNRLVGADAGNVDVEIYAYPKGGSPIQIVSGFSEPIGVTVIGAKGK
jgi:hypothetical protein